MAWLETQRQNFILWVPVALAFGIGGYFSFPFEPAAWMSWGLASGQLALLWLIWRVSGPVRLLILILFVLNSGYLAAVYRSAAVAAPILGFRYYGVVEGRIIKIDRSKSKAIRLTLDRVVLERVDQPPSKIRVSLFGFSPNLALGDRVNLVGSLSPPSGPTEPGGFDFRRYAWFNQLGGLGYTRNPVVVMRPYADGAQGLWLANIRRQLARHIATSVGGRNGAFAAAILTGDRSRIDDEVLQTLRDSNLAHLLAISGLHMGLLTGFVFLLFRYGMAAFPRVALGLPVKKIGAVAALLIGLGYLFLSGGSVATQRAFIMVTVVLLAVMLDRPAFTLRAVALAAVLVLLLRPESLLEAGFQMSFAATTALVGSFEMLRKAHWWAVLKQVLPRWAGSILALVFTSAIAGAATAPIAAFHFNQISNFGLLANLLTVPLMGLVIMPAALIALFLSVFGMGDFAFWLMGQGVAWVLWVAERFSTMEMSVTYVQNAPWMVLPMIALAGCLGFLLIGRARVSAIILFLMALVLWMKNERPLILVNNNAALIGVMQSQGRVLNKETAYGFVANIWLENDGDTGDQPAAYNRLGFFTQDRISTIMIENGWKLVLDQNNQGFGQSCMANTILIAPKQYSRPEGNCRFIGKLELADLAGFAIAFEGGVPRIIPAAPRFLSRPWTNSRP